MELATFTEAELAQSMQLDTLTDLNLDEEMEKDAAEPLVTPKAPTKKRSRAPPKVEGPGVVIIGNRFVCTYSGRILDRAVFIPGVQGAAFSNIPCAMGWLTRESGAQTSQVDNLKVKLAEKYSQEPDQLPIAPPRQQLVDFGGERFYHEWIAGLDLWDRLTEAQGYTVSEYQLSSTNKVLKRGKNRTQRLTFEPDLYSIAYGKGPAGCRRVNALDSTEQEGDVKAIMTAVKAYRKLNTFFNRERVDGQECYAFRHVFVDGYYLIGFVAAEGYVPDAKFTNNIATQLGGMPMYGPAVATFTRKFSQKI